MEILIGLLIFTFIITSFAANSGRVLAANNDEMGSSCISNSFDNFSFTNTQLANGAVDLAINNFQSEVESIESISPDVFKELVKNKDHYQLLSMSMHIALLTYVFKQKTQLNSEYYDTVISQFNNPDEAAFKINSYLAELEIDEEKAIDVFIRDVMTAFGGNGLIVDFTAIASLMRSSHFDALNLYKNEISIEQK